MGMDTRTGAIRQLREGEAIAELPDDPTGPLPAEVGITAGEAQELRELPPDLRLAHLFGMRGGKDRRASRTPPKTERQRRYERAAARKARQRG